MCVWMCVCVCVRERDREREREGGGKGREGGREGGRVGGREGGSNVRSENLTLELASPRTILPCCSQGLHTQHHRRMLIINNPRT